MIPKHSFSALAITALIAFTANGSNAEGYKLTNLVANKQIYGAQILDKAMVNAWGLANRPAGAGGHIWINNTDTGTVGLYIGDTPEQNLYQDETPLITIALPKNSKEEHSAPTGQVFNGNDKEFIITQDGITGAAKFMFVTEEGTLSAWTERKREDGKFDRPKSSLVMIDNSKKGAVYKGLAISTKPDGNYLYAANFAGRKIDVFDNTFKPTQLGKQAFVLPKGSMPSGYSPFNIQAIDGSLYVIYAKLARHSKEAGEEEKGEGLGYVAEFDFDGNFKRMLEGGKMLNAPWGIALAPAEFGIHSGHLLVGNFGDGRIIAFDRQTGKQLEPLKTPKGEPIEIDGLWGLLFGNGVHLGYANHLYFAAGPNDEKDGVFGKLEPVGKPR
ncbi:MAG: TIGR03118 family protein [Alphaproteobacteria bacterium]|nr:TIGR03118 family protein [Alphaproteobacteria bacterium]